jgi:glucosylceramidase
MAFGFTLTGGSASLLNGLGGNQANVLNELFGTGAGQIGISYLRISIGASDLSSSDFTYNQTAGDVNMNNFSLAQENTDFLPILKKIIAINPSIKIIATPWTAPTWMKVNTTGNNGYTGGSFNTAYYACLCPLLCKIPAGHAGAGHYHRCHHPAKRAAEPLQ